MAALVETVRQARSELVLPDTFGNRLPVEAQKLPALGPPP